MVRRIVLNERGTPMVLRQLYHHLRYSLFLIPVQFVICCYFNKSYFIRCSFYPAFIVRVYATSYLICSNNTLMKELPRYGQVYCTLLIDCAKISLLGKKREDGGQNHCASTISFAFRKGKF